MGLNVFNYDCPGQLSLFELDTLPFKITKPIRLIELFAGIGSQAMALRNIDADFEHYRVVEIDKYAIASYNAIHGTSFETTDITKIGGVDLGIKDKDKYCYIMTYSFPCQDLSVAGKMAGMDKGSGTRSGLLWEVERLLNETPELPQVLLMENVPNVHGASNAENFSKWMNCLEWMGYKNYWQDLNAKEYGVGQSRNRCFMVSVLGNCGYEFPKPIESDKCIADYLEERPDEKLYVNTDRARETIDRIIIGGKLSDYTTNRQVTLDSLGVGGERGVVYGVNGIAPCESATQYKDPTKICELYRIH